VENISRFSENARNQFRLTPYLRMDGLFEHRVPVIGAFKGFDCRRWFVPHRLCRIGFL